MFSSIFEHYKNISFISIVYISNTILNYRLKHLTVTISFHTFIWNLWNSCYKADSELDWYLSNYIVTFHLYMIKWKNAI